MTPELLTVINDGIEINDSTLRVSRREDGWQLNGRVWTKSSGYLSWSDGVLYCDVRGKVLQSVDSAVDFRHGSQGDDHSDKCQSTGTLVGYELTDEGVRAYVTELSREHLVALAKRVYDKYSLEVELDSELAQAIKRMGENRTHLVTERIVEFSVISEKGKPSEYETSPVVRAYLPSTARKNAEYIRAKNFCVGKVWFERFAPSQGMLLVLPVWFGGVDVHGKVYSLGAESGFNAGGRARGQ